MEDEVEFSSAESWSQTRWNRLPVAMVVLELESFLVVEANAALALLAGYGLDELEGNPVSLFVPELDQCSLELALADSTEDDITLKTMLLRQDGESLPVQINFSRPFEYTGREFVIGALRNATHERDMDQRLAAKRWALHAYADVALTLVRAQSSATLLQEIAEAITWDSPFVLAWIGLVGEEPDYIINIQAKAGPAMDYLEDLEISGSGSFAGGRGPVGIAFRSGEAQFVADVETDENYRPWRERARNAGIRCMITIPFQVGEAQDGILGVYSSEPNAFGPVVYAAFRHLAQEIGVGLHSLRQREQIEQERAAREAAQRQLAEALTATVGAIAGAFEAGDSYTGGHQSRVATFAAEIARELGWGEDQIQGLRMAAMIHDIGKLAVPHGILSKQDKLTPEEFEQIKEHPKVGYRILKDIPFPWPIADIVHQHHEKLDGSGYPLGLQGDRILPGARVLAVADIVESMACERPYHKALSVEIALGEVESLAAQGKLDPEVVAVCARMFREQGYELPRTDSEE